jgi:hypothetical protein
MSTHLGSNDIKLQYITYLVVQNDVNSLGK